MVFDDCSGQLIWDGGVDITGVYGYENEAPLIQIDIENYNLDNQEEVHPKQEDQTLKQTVKIE